MITSVISVRHNYYNSMYTNSVHFFSFYAWESKMIFLQISGKYHIISGNGSATQPSNLMLHLHGMAGSCRQYGLLCWNAFCYCSNLHWQSNGSKRVSSNSLHNIGEQIPLLVIHIHFTIKLIDCNFAYIYS